MDRDDDGSNPFTNNIVVLLLAMGSAAFVVSLYHLIVLCCCGHRNTDDQNPPQGHHNRQREPGELSEPSTSNSVAHLIPSHRYHKKNVTGDGGGDGAATCAVCLGDFEEGEELKALPECGHSFHVSCIDTWLHSHASCPVCRASATPSPAGLHHSPSNLLPPDFGHGGGQHHGIGMVQIAVVQNGFVRR